MKKILVIVCSILLTFGMVGVVGASMITASPSTPTALVGDTVIVDISGSGFVDGVGGSSGGGLILTWDPGVLTLNDALINPNPTGNPSLFASVNYTFPGDMQFGVLNETFPGSGVWPTPAVLDTAGGSFTFSTSSLTGTGLADFPIASIAFLASGQGLSSLVLALEAIDPWTDALSTEIPNPDLVVNDVNVNAVPIPGSILLLGSGLVGLIGIARRKRS